MSHPRTLIVAGERSQLRVVETYVSAAGARHFTNAVTEVVAGEERRDRSLQGAEGERRGLPHRHMQINAGAQQPTSRRMRSRSAAASSATTSARCSTAKAPKRRSTASTSPTASSTSTTTRRSTTPSRTARATSSTRASSAATPRRLQRQDHRPPGRAEDRRQADQPGAAAVRRRDHQHQAAARDLRRRREVHARRDDRPARRGRDLLPARPRPDVRGGARLLTHAFASDIIERGPDRASCRRRSKKSSTRQLARDLAEVGRGMTPTAAAARAAPAASTSRRSASRLPDSAAAGARQAAGLSRQRRDDAEAAGRHRRAHALLQRGQRQRPPRRPPPERARHRGLRGTRGEGQLLLNAAGRREIIFTRSTTEGINLVAQTFGRTHVGAGDEILISAMEHHSNIVPWQMLCEEKGATLRVVPINDAASCCWTSSTSC